MLLSWFLLGWLSVVNYYYFFLVLYFYQIEILTWIARKPSTYFGSQSAASCRLLVDCRSCLSFLLLHHPLSVSTRLSKTATFEICDYINKLFNDDSNSTVVILHSLNERRSAVLGNSGGGVIIERLVAWNCFLLSSLFVEFESFDLKSSQVLHYTMALVLIMRWIWIIFPEHYRHPCSFAYTHTHSSFLLSFQST